MTTWTAAASSTPVLEKLDMSAAPPSMGAARSRVAAVKAKRGKDLRAYRSRAATTASRRRGT